MDDRKGLLDLLHERVGCEYLSALRDPRWRPSLIEVIRETEFQAFTARQWSEAVSYLFDVETSIDSLADLHALLMSIIEE